MTDMKIGILSVQGDVAENVISTEDALIELQESGEVITIKKPEEISQLDGLIIPGGESTMIGQLSLVNGALKEIKGKIDSGMPVLGICAGLIILSKNAKDRVVGKTEQPLLDLLDVEIERNSFGRQRDSFEADLNMDGLGISNFNGVFIRAPSIRETGSGVEVLSKLGDKIVAVKQGNILGTAFHPELTEDASVHKYFVNMVKQSKQN